MLKLDLSQNHLMQCSVTFVSTGSPERLLNTNCWASSPESVVERENLYLSEVLMYS